MSTAPSPLEAELRRMIAAEGPLPVARYMALCLSHPRHGYYMRGDPFGAGGDFTTAPEISQIFGELVGLWAVAVWLKMGASDPFVLVELGPGRGTLMADALRASKIVPGFRTAAAVHLVETSPALRARQAETLAAAGVRPIWNAALHEVPEAPAIVIANEFFDALPVHQAVKAKDGWHARVVGLDSDGRLAFGVQAKPIAHFEAMLPARLREAKSGSIYEWRSDMTARDLCRRLKSAGGAALVIDYGHLESGIGDTLQAVHRHGFADPLQRPGEADITAHVDFGALRAIATSAGVKVHGPTTQGAFLRTLGIEARAAKLRQSATEAQSADIDAAVVRLAGSGLDAMGELFKVIGLSHPGTGALPGFDT